MDLLMNWIYLEKVIYLSLFIVKAMFQFDLPAYSVILI